MSHATITFAFLVLLTFGGVAAGAEESPGQDPIAAGDHALEAGAKVRELDDAEPIGSFGDAVTVVSASRRRERIVDAPAAVTVILNEEIERQSAATQVPKLLQFTPGVEITQSGLYDFNFNVRGFNASLNRRILVLIDGRDPSMGFLGSQEWQTLSVLLHDLEGLELVRGPSSALYGSNAVNGVLNLTTRSTQGQQGGRLELAGGELDTRRLDVSHAGLLGGDWTYRASGGYQKSEDFSRSRHQSLEYPGLVPEVVPLALDEVELAFGSLRFDRAFDTTGGLLTLEGGTHRSEGPLALTNAGRFQVTDLERPWAHLRFSTPRWSALAAYTARDNPELIQLNAGVAGALDSERTQLEIQGNKDLAGQKARLVAGTSYARTSVDTSNEQGQQTYLLQEQTEERWGIFAQLDYELGDRVKAVIAARWDESNLHDAEFSPKAALVISPRPDHRLRLTYNQAFQPPNIGEFFTHVPVAAPLDLSGIEQALGSILGGVSLGLGHVPILGLGNANLSTESIESFEIGYSATLGNKTFLTLDVYHSELRDFVSALLPQLGTSLGRLNPDFGPYQTPEGLSPDAAATVQATLQSAIPGLYPLLSNDSGGSPIIALLSHTNVGKAETTGVEAAITASLTRRLRFHFNYSYFDFEIQEDALENPIRPNAPQNKLALSLTYTGPRYDAVVGYRWSDGFDWRGGLYVGEVPSYGLVDLAANVSLNDHWRAGINVSNLLDQEHYEIFGGDLLGRRAIAHVSFSW